MFRFELPCQAREMRADSRRLIDGDLFLDREVHHQVQERVGRAMFRQVVLLLMTFRIFQHGMVFRVFAMSCAARSSSGVSNSPALRLRQDSNKKLRASSRVGLNSIGILLKGEFHHEDTKCTKKARIISGLYLVLPVCINSLAGT